MIPYEDAKMIVLRAGQAHGCKTETVSTQNTVGRVCSQDIKAPIDIQPFDNSAMDGFAVRLDDLNSNGGVLTKSSMIAAGDNVPDDAIQAGCCVEIMTGAPVPPGVEAIVPVELVEVDGNQVNFNMKPEEGAHIRKSGEDFRQGTGILESGQMVKTQHIMPLAALGIDKIQVYKKPRAVFLATGNELVEDLSHDLDSGQIYNSNRPYGLATLEAMGVECIEVPTMPDDSDKFEALLKGFASRDIDFIVSSGAVSAGKFDFVRKGLEQAGAEILFHKVKIKPGKPNLFARLPNGTLYFGLPGNPAATAAGLRFFVQPCLCAMLGMAREKHVCAKVTSSFKKRAGVTMFLKARAKSIEDGTLLVDLLDGQASFMVSPFLTMNCWAVVPEDSEEIKVGDIVDVHSLYPHSGFL